MSLLKPILGSVLSVTAGWLACTGAWAVIAAILTLSEESFSTALFVGLGFALYVGLVCGAFAFATWLIAFVWLYLLLPASSRLWLWRLAAPVGAVVGAAIVAVPLLLFAREDGLGSLVVFVPSAALTGGVAAACAALTRRFFHALPQPTAFAG
jgi:hypothetical protein